MNELLANLGNWFNPELLGNILLQWSGRLLAALVVFLVGRWIALALSGWCGRILEKARVDATLTRFLRSLIYMTMLVVVILTAVGALGVPTTNFLAILGAAGLAIGLALKDSLANFSSGVMLVFFRPFRVGDFVEAAGVSGTVDSIGIFSTVFKTPDNRVIIVPNALIFGGLITNYSAEARRRIDLVIAISYAGDIERAMQIIKGVLKTHAKVCADPAAEVMVLDLSEIGVNIAVRPWVDTAEYWNVRGELLSQLKRALETNGFSVPHRAVQLVSGAAGAA
ncbi:MAG TPA: mechanosensitive ion channel domain-containing protein [Gammaproteobacteria bacterium]|jgi:small conductance mechanosensitive channel